MPPETYRGRTIDADTNSDGAWVAIVDGNETKAKPQRSRTDAMRSARGSVNRSLGKLGEKKEVSTLSSDIDPTAPEPEFWANMRKAIGE